MLESYALNSGLYRLVITVIVNVAISDTLKEMATILRSDKFLAQMIIFPIVRFIILRIIKIYPIDVIKMDHTILASTRNESRIMIIGDRIHVIT